MLFHRRQLGRLAQRRVDAALPAAARAAIVGEDVTVETTLGTLRHGTLVKYTNPALTLQLGPEHGSIELTVPRDTVRNVSGSTAPPAAQPPHHSVGSPPERQTP